MEFFAFPVNALILLALFDGIVISYVLKRNSSVIRFLGSIQVSIVAIALFVIAIIVKGVVPQFRGSLAESVVFFVVVAFFLLSLGFAAIKRTIPFDKRNLWYIVTHWGLWITIAAFAFGSFDRKTYDVNVFQDVRNNVAQSNSADEVLLPFVMSFSDFHIDKNASNETENVCVDVEFFWKNEDYDFATISVNNPYVKNSWIVSLEKYECASDGSQAQCVFSVLYDSWQFLVEFGFALLCCGVLMMVFHFAKKD